MTEKVIFEFRATRTEDGLHYEVRHDAEETFSAFYPAPWMGCIPRSPRPKLHRWPRRGKRFAKRHMRQALDSLESLYDDLYSEETEETIE